MIGKLIKYLKLFRVLVKNCLIGYLEYGSNFAMEFISESVYIIMKLVYIYAICKSAKSIAGYSSDYVLILGGNYLILTGFFVGFFMMNFFNISDQIKDGSLDVLLTKPISLQFSVSFKQFQFGAMIPDIVAGVTLIVVGLSRYSVRILWYNILLYVILMIISIILIYSIFFILQMTSFWFVKTQALNSIFETLWDYNNMPMHIYSKRIINIGIYLVPLFIISNFPVMCLLGNLKGFYIIWAGLVAIFMFTLSRIVWKRAIKRYSSASS